MTTDQTDQAAPDADILATGFLNNEIAGEGGAYALEGVEGGDDKLDGDWTTQAESNQFGPWVDYMRDSSTTSLAGFMSWVRSSKLNEDQRKLSLKKESAGNIQMSAVCNNRIAHLRALSRQTRILTDFRKTGALQDPLKPSALNLDEAEIAIVMELESVRSIYGDDRSDITNKIVDHRLNQINKQRRKISRSISRDIARGVFKDYGRLNALMEKSERAGASGRRGRASSRHDARPAPRELHDGNVHSVRHRIAALADHHHQAAGQRRDERRKASDEQRPQRTQGRGPAAQPRVRAEQRGRRLLMTTESNDLLMIFTEDGDIIEDNKVQQVYGYLVSHFFKMAFPMNGPPIPLYKWRRGDESPTKEKSVYVMDSEGEPAENDALLINKVLKNVRDDAKNGDWNVNKRLYQQRNFWASIICCIIWGAVGYVGIDGHQKRTDLGVFYSREVRQADIERKQTEAEVMREQVVQQVRQEYAEQGGVLVETTEVEVAPTPEPTPTPAPIRIRK